jgi:hypothetical protein
MGFERRWCLVLMLALCIGAGTSILAWDNNRVHDIAPRFHWPDETTNAYFASLVARGESLIVPEPRNVFVGNMIHPRTANVRPDGGVVPGGFLGLAWWYGLLGRMIGERMIWFLTPALAMLAMLSLFHALRRVIDVRVASTAVAFLALLSPWWLFTATTMLPNVPFVALVIIGLAMIVCDQGRPDGGSARSWRWLVGGLMIGLALTIRTHEFVWVLPLVGVVAWGSRLTKMHSVLGSIGLVFPFLPILILQSQLYGGPLVTGYALLQQGGALPTEFTGPGFLQAIVAPFGWSVVTAFQRFWIYAVVPYWWLATLAAIGILSVFVVRGYESKSMRKPSVGSLVLAVWLILYYGSWDLADPLVRASNILTISYVRYWLPVFVLMAIWGAVGFHALCDRFGERWRPALAASMMLGIVMLALPPIFFHPSEGLRAQRAQLNEHRERARAVIATTPDDAVIVSHRMDKAFFPERAVVHAPASVDDAFRNRLQELVRAAPVYWYGPSIPDLKDFSIEPFSGMPFGEQLVSVRSAI